MVRAGLFLLFLMIFALPLQSLTDSKQQQQPNCDKAFATNFIVFWNKNKYRLVDTSNEYLVDDYKSLTEDIMLRLAMFDNTGCRSETQKRIQTLYDNSSKLQASYEQILMLDAKFKNAPTEEKKTILEQVRKQRKSHRTLHTTYLQNLSRMHDYVSTQIN